MALARQSGVRALDRRSWARAFLDGRLARGEIDPDEYTARKAAIEGA